MSDIKDNADLSHRLRQAIDPLLPDAAAARRVLDGISQRLDDGGDRTRAAWYPGSLPAWAAPAGVALVIAGAFTLGLVLRGPLRTASVATKPTVVAPVQPPPATAVSPGIPNSSITSVQTTSLAFPSVNDGWVVGNGCDAQQHCRLATARTTDGGSVWSLVGMPPNLDVSGADHIAAASALDAWVWGNTASTLSTFFATHDGGVTWAAVPLGSAMASVVSVSGGSVWVKTDCPTPAAGCARELLSSAVGGGPWVHLATLPVSVQAPPRPAQGTDGSLVRTAKTAWVVGSAGGDTENAIARSDDGGHTWQTLSTPCQSGSRVFLAASSKDSVMLVCTAEGALPAPEAVWTSYTGGSTWTLQSRQQYTGYSPPLPDVGHIGSGGYATGVVLLDPSTAWMTQGREDDLVSHDGGRTWSHAALPAAYFGQAGGAGGIDFVDSSHGWTFASDGLWRTSDGGAIWHYQAVIGAVTGY